MRIGYRFHPGYEENYWAVIVVEPTGYENVLIEKCSTKLIAHQISFDLNAQVCIAEELGYKFYIKDGEDGIRSWRYKVCHNCITIGTYPTFPEAIEAIEKRLRADKVRLMAHTNFAISRYAEPFAGVNNDNE